MNNEILAQARQLSSNTISYLIQDTNYETIDQVQQEFVLFIHESGKSYGSWQEAWIDFRLKTKYVGISTLVNV